LSAEVRPKIVVSKCLGFAACRYNGQSIRVTTVEGLLPYADLTPVCPEVEIGLGVPRSPLRLIDMDGGVRLVQPATGLDATEKMRRFSQGFLAAQSDVDAFLVKSRSPSCGYRDTKLYPSAERTAPSAKGSGLFGASIGSRFPRSALEDEARLRNFTIRERFLTKLFTLARFRTVKAARSAGELVAFHTANKLLLVSRSQQEARRLGRIVANIEKRPVSEVIDEYEECLAAALLAPSRRPSNINVLQHAFGHISKRLSSKEKRFFLEALDDYRVGKIPLSSVISVMDSWIVRFDDEYLRGQTFFQPYPSALSDVSDSGKGRDY
jgi:uncharacterized protein YbgA (DUF1722 family)/uncharacterized protein YbbK (DUF523 family)